MLVSIFMVFEWVPTEEDQGIVQRIFYFHVPCAWVAFAAFGIVAIAGVFYLWLKDQIWDDLGYAAAEIGMVFCTLVLITGSLWAKPIWGTWWTWDSRLTTTFILWLLYGGYLMLRAMADDTPEVARFGAVIGIVAALDVPVVILSVRLWRTIHPAVLVTRAGEHGLEDPRMVIDAADFARGVHRDVRLVADAALPAVAHAQPADHHQARRGADRGGGRRLLGKGLMEHFDYLFAAYTIIFVVIFAYVMFIWRRQARLETDLRAMEERLKSLKIAESSRGMKRAGEN